MVDLYHPADGDPDDPVQATIAPVVAWGRAITTYLQECQTLTRRLHEVETYEGHSVMCPPHCDRPDHDVSNKLDQLRAANAQRMWDLIVALAQAVDTYPGH